MALKWAYSRRKVLDPIRGKYPSGVETFLDGEKIDNLVEWKIGIWNSGNRPIRSADFIEENAIEISFSESEILKAEASKTSRDVVGGSITFGPNQIKISDIQILDSGDYLLLTCYGRLSDQDAELSKTHRPKISAHVARIPRGAIYISSPFASGWIDRLFLVFGGFLYLGFGSGLIIGGLASILDSPGIDDLNSAIDGFAIPTVLAWIAVPAGIVVALVGTLVFLMIAVSFFGNPPKAVRQALHNDSVLALRFARFARFR
ncbi:hypothetical protein [Sphingopyxis fribergensis]|nr:hypothetical protein [Sphingopyxis fribergensis]